ncbi:hypothetical protein LCGC14_0988740 [marine sediment metagenome]|uniref:Uncharacterized protein n=1 Tax=marine sediment metagenome TaxID=412755 RepID=A0A0F9N6C8_9ZZZZ
MPRRKWLISELPDKSRCPHCHKLGLTDDHNEEGDLGCVCCGERVYKVPPLPYIRRIYTKQGWRPSLV